LAALFDCYWERLADFAFKRIRSLEDTEEIVQDVFIKLFERRAALEVHTSLEAYLFTAVRYRVYNKIRDRIQIRKMHHAVSGVDESYALSEHLLEYKEMEHHIRQAVERLPEQCRKVFILRREYQLSNRRIAERLNLSVNTVEKHMGKALRLLKEELSKQDIAIALLLLILL